MDTKSKNSRQIRYSNGAKALCWIVCIVCACGMFFTIGVMLEVRYLWPNDYNIYYSGITNIDSPFSVLIIGLFLIFAIAFIWLMVSAGKTKRDSTVSLLASDRLVYLDIGFFIMLGVVILLGFGAYGSLYSFGNFYDVYGGIEAFTISLFILCVGGAVSAILVWSTSLARRIKDGSANRFTLLYAIFGGLKKAYDQSGAGAKGVMVLLLYITCGLIVSGTLLSSIRDGEGGGLLISLALLVVYIVLSIKFILKSAAAVAGIEEGVARIKGGDTEYHIEPRGNMHTQNIAEGINNLAEGLSSAVKKEVQSERMRTELITNVSHDLKTPLTSILSYVDLLKKEDGLDATAAKYVDVLDMKSRRLKVLTDDLFDAAKAASGDMTVELSRIELTEFMDQAMGELGDQVRASTLEFVNDIPSDKMYVTVDGKLLFRVINNVFDNAIKYALRDSRVYITAANGPDGVVLTVKNVSAQKLNISEDELMERFVRGDESRNTEGSGLGLAISKNFMSLMGGEFSIDIDGDLFKANIRLAPG